MTFVLGINTGVPGHCFVFLFTLCCRLGRKIGSGSFGDIYLGMFLLKRVETEPGAGVHIPTGEEVGIKLVCRLLSRICLDC